jgi:TolB-like protein
VRIKEWILWTLVLGLMAVFGCASNTQQSYVDETLGVGFVKKIAILPFENNTSEKFVEERLRDTVTTEILSRALFDVVEKGELQRFLRQEVLAKKENLLDLQTAKRMGQELSVEAYLAGSVDDFTENRNGSYTYPVLAATFRLVDANTGKILWQVTASESAYSTWDRIFGLASEDSNQIGFILVRKMLDTLQDN